MAVAKTWEEIQEIKAKQIRTGCRSVSYVDVDEILYRGHSIRRRDSVPTGYYGRYAIRLKGLHYGPSTLCKAKQVIDTFLAETESASTNAVAV